MFWSEDGEAARSRVECSGLECSNMLLNVRKVVSCAQWVVLVPGCSFLRSNGKMSAGLGISARPQKCQHTYYPERKMVNSQTGKGLQ